MSKDKHIEEKHNLSESIYMSGHGLDWKDSDDIAEQLYTEGYRKQSEGEWVEIDDGVLIRDGKHLECSKCGVWSRSRQRTNYCSSCGAKMKGGAK
jgi:hypothetical protein